MKFLCDVHITYRLVKKLNELGCASQHVNNLANRWHSTDDEIAEFADRFGYILISKDADFKNSFFLRTTPKKFLKISLGNLSNDQLIQTVVNLVPLMRSLDQRERFLMEVDASGRAVVV